MISIPLQLEKVDVRFASRCRIKSRLYYMHSDLCPSVKYVSPPEEVDHIEEVIDMFLTGGATH